MKLTTKDKEGILEFHKKGKSNRWIAREYLGKESRESSVRNYLESLQDEELDYAEDVGCKILLIDIETAPTRSYSWRRWKQNISQDMVIAEGFVLTWAAKWLNEDAIATDALSIENLANEDDHDICLSIWELINQADIVIGHNGRRFDLPILNSRFVYHGFVPPSSYKIVDTLDIAKKYFGFPSNSLDSLSSYLNIGRKIDTGGFQLWVDCLAGDEEAWEKMIDYNIHDVDLLESVYLKLRAWDKSHPNVTLYSPSADLACPCCGSKAMSLTGTDVFTGVSRFPEYRCDDCGKLSRGRKNKFPKERMENILVNIGG